MAVTRTLARKNTSTTAAANTDIVGSSSAPRDIPLENIANNTSTLSSSYRKASANELEIGDQIARDSTELDLESSSSSDEYDIFAHEEAQFPEGERGWIVVLGSCLGLVTVFGIMNTIGVIEQYVQSNQLAGVNTSAVAWVFSLYMFFTLIGGVVSGTLFDTVGARKVLLPGMILNCLGLFALPNCTKLWHFILAFGFASGIGASLMMNPLIGVVSHWFLKKRGLAIGVSQMGSIGGVIFPLMLNSLIPKVGYEWSMRIIAFICLGLCVTSFCLVKDRLEEITPPQSRTTHDSIFKKIFKSIDFNALKDKRYSLLVAALFMNEFSLLVCITYISSYAVARGASSSSSYILLTVMNAFGTIGKWIPAQLADYVGRFNMMILMSFTMSLTIFVMWLPFYNMTALYVFVSIYGFAFSATYSLTATCVGQISKTSAFGVRYGTAYFFVSFGNLISIPLGGALIKDGSIANYNNAIIFAGCTSVLATLLFVASRYTIVGSRIKVFV